MKAASRQSKQRPDKVATTLIPRAGRPAPRPWSAIAGSVAPSSKTTGNAKSNLGANSTPARRASPTLAVDSIGGAKDLSPYWSDYSAAISSRLWLPTGIDLPGSDLSLANGWPSRTAAASWFWVSENTAPNRNSPKLFSPCSRPSVAGCTDSAGTKTQSRRIRIYPTPEQKKLLRLWFDAARWNYNETIAWLQETQEKAVWKADKDSDYSLCPGTIEGCPLPGAKHSGS